MGRSPATRPRRPTVPLAVTPIFPTHLDDVVLHCPFCGAPESDRIDVEGRRFVVFPCVFTPELDPSLSEEEAQRRLDETSPAGGGPYFRKMCDRLHLYVTAGAGGERLTGRSEPSAASVREDRPPTESR